MHSIFDVASALGATPSAKGLSGLCEVVSGSTEIDGAAVDSQGYTTAMLLIALGAVAGTPDAVSLAFKVQTSDDGSTNWTDVVSKTLTAADASKVTAVRVGDSLPLNVKRYFRTIVTPTFTNGTSPSVPVAAVLVGSRYAFDPVNS